jgi:hypothetical protein
MSDKPTQGVLLKSEDGHNYFIPESNLNGYSITDAEVDNEHILRHAPAVDAWRAEQGEGPNSVVMAMLTDANS